MIVLGFAAVCVLGAWGRVGLAELLDRPRFAWGTLAVNLLGSLTAGVLHARLDGAARTVAVAGALGAFTTFSAFATRVTEDLRAGHRARAAAYGVATTVGAVGAAVVGLLLGR